MARRSGRMDFISEPERLLAALKDARAESVRAQSGVKIGNEVYQALEAFRMAVDDLAGVVAGNREALWIKPHKAE